MQTKKKNRLVVAVVVLSVALIAAIGAIIGVYAATQQNVSTSFTVSYDVGKNIALKVTSSYQIAGEDKVTLDEVKFNVPEASQTKTVSIPNITLTGDKPYVDFSYRFETLNDQEIALDVFWENLLENSENIKISATYYFMGNTGVTIWAEVNPDNASLGGAPFNLSSNANTTSNTFPIIPTNGWNYIQCDYRFQIDDVNKSAYITSSAEGGLTFSFQSY